MEPFEVLKQLEEFYDLLKPADENSHEAFAWFSGVPHPLFNAVMHLACERSVEVKVDALLAKIPKNNPVSFWIHPCNNADGLVKILNERGFMPVANCLLMAWPVKEVALPRYDIRLADAETFHEILATVYQFNEAIKEGFIKLLKNEGLENYLVYLEGKPIGIGSLFAHGQAGGIFNLATLPEHQKKGCGRAMMQSLMRRAYELGLKQIVLLSGVETEKLYRDLEFRKVCGVEIFAR